MKRTIRHRLCLTIIAAAGLASTQAPARERLLRCATSQASTRFGHPTPDAARRRSYAPLRNAMFFSPPGSACRWRVAQRHG